MPLTKAQLNEWCDTLEAHPERQTTGQLVDPTGTKFCCLGQLAVLNGAEIVPSYEFVGDGEKDLCFAHGGLYITGHSYLQGDILNTFGSDGGIFSELDMPWLVYESRKFRSASLANDDGVPWGVIAKHFREHYKTAD